MPDTVVIYFSVSKTTERAAQTLAKLLGADIAPLEPVTPYSDQYDQIVARGEREKDQALRPAIKPLPVNLKAYHTVYLGFPTWWANPPMVMTTFFETNDLAGKQIVPFTTSMSSTIADSQAVLQQLANAAGATLEPGLTANSTTAIREFIQ